MTDIIPSMQQLKTFRAAADCLSFKQTADELNLTASAVSHQIKSLEELLGVTLFTRSTRNLSLTSAGKEYLALIDEVLQLLIKGNRQFVHRHIQKTFTITCLGSIAEQFVIPYMGKVQAEFPEVKFQVDTETRHLNFTEENIDIGIRVGSGEWPSLKAEHLINTWILPACTREYIKANPVSTASDFLNNTLIDIHDDLRGWKLWAKHQGLEDFSPQNVLILTEPGAAIRATEQGLGVLMAHIPLVTQQLSSGKLVVPIKKIVESDMAAYIVYRSELEHDEVLLGVKELIFNVVKNYPAPPPD